MNWFTKLFEKLFPSVSIMSGFIRKLFIGGFFVAQFFNQDGTLDRVDVYQNGMCTAGMTDLLSVYFDGGTQKTNWYLGLISATSYTTGILAADTSASHSGWTEATAYDEATRPEWEPTVSGTEAANDDRVEFTMSSAATIKGSFIISNNTKGGSTGILFAHGLFTQGDYTARAGQVIRLTYRFVVAGI